MKHEITPPAAETLEELGTKVAQLRYDAMIIFFRAFNEEIIRQRDVDEERGREYTSFVAQYVILSIHECLRHVKELLKTSAPYMKKDIEEHPLLVDPKET